MLTDDQLRHFAEHGWVLQERVFDHDQVEAFKRGLDDQIEELSPWAIHADTADILNADMMPEVSRVFRDWYRNPRAIAANRQLMGAHLKATGSHAKITDPHPDRHTRRAELADPDRWGWHRGSRPKWCIFPDDDDPELINCTFLNNITYLTDVEPGDGGTAVLDRSHVREGDYASLKHELDVVQPRARAGDVLHFSETLIHSGCPILSENRRYALFYGFHPRWHQSYAGERYNPQLVRHIRDPELRELMGDYEGFNFSGQYPDVRIPQACTV